MKSAVMLLGVILVLIVLVVLVPILTNNEVDIPLGNQSKSMPSTTIPLEENRGIREEFICNASGWQNLQPMELSSEYRSKDQSFSVSFFNLAGGAVNITSVVVKEVSSNTVCDSLLLNQEPIGKGAVTLSPGFGFTLEAKCGPALKKKGEPYNMSIEINFTFSSNFIAKRDIGNIEGKTDMFYVPEPGWKEFQHSWETYLSNENILSFRLWRVKEGSVKLVDVSAIDPASDARCGQAKINNASVGNGFIVEPNLPFVVTLICEGFPKERGEDYRLLVVLDYRDLDDRNQIKDAEGGFVEGLVE